MSTAVSRRRGTTAEHATFHGVLGEFTYDSDKKVVVAHDGVTDGGFPMAPAVSPAFTGTPTAPTAAPGDNTTQIATTAFVSAISAAGVLPAGYLSGGKISNNVADVTNDIDISAATARDSTNTADIVLAAALTKRFDAVWSVGSGGGILGGASLTTGRTYHVHLIKRPDTGVVDVIASLSHDEAKTVTMTIASPCVVTWGVAGDGHGLQEQSPIKFSTTGALPTGVTAGTQYYVSTGFTETTFSFSATPGGANVNSSGGQSGVHTGLAGPALPANYTKFTRIASLQFVSTSVPLIKQYGRFFQFAVPSVDINAFTQTISATLHTLTSLPIGIKVNAKLNVQHTRNATSTYISITSPDQTDTAPAVGNLLGVFGGGATSTFSGEAHVMTDRSRQVRARAFSASSLMTLSPFGWFDDRDRG